MSKPNSDTVFWVGIHPEVLHEQWPTVSSKIRALSGDFTTPLIQDDVELYLFQFWRIGFGIGVPLPGFSREQGFRITELASAIASARAKVIPVLTALGVKDTERQVMAFSVGPIQ